MHQDTQMKKHYSLLVSDKGHWLLLGSKSGRNFSNGHDLQNALVILSGFGLCTSDQYIPPLERVSLPFCEMLKAFLNLHHCNNKIKSSTLLVSRALTVCRIA